MRKFVKKYQRTYKGKFLIMATYPEIRAWIKNKYGFRLVRAVFAKNVQLTEKGGFIFNWIA